MTNWRRRFTDEEDPEDREVRGTGLWCRQCLEEMDRGQLYGVGERGGVLCADCADLVWEELSGEEKLELLGYEVTDRWRD